MRQQSPPHHSRNALTVLRADCDQHRLGRRLIPTGLEIWRHGIWREPQADFDFRIIRGETHATTHNAYLVTDDEGSTFPCSRSTIAPFRNVRRSPPYCTTAASNAAWAMALLEVAAMTMRR